MKSSLTRSIIAALAGLAIACSASALTIGDANYLGSVNPSQPPGGPDQDVININILNNLAIGATLTVDSKLHSRVGSTLVGAPFPDVSVAGYDKQDNGNTSVTLDASFLYISGKFGPGQHIWYFPNGAPLSFTMPATSGFGGLSHTSGFGLVVGRVSDGGSTVALLGLGLALLGIARRKLA